MLLSAIFIAGIRLQGGVEAQTPTSTQPPIFVTATPRGTATPDCIVYPVNCYVQGTQTATHSPGYGTALPTGVFDSRCPPDPAGVVQSELDYEYARMCSHCFTSEEENDLLISTRSPLGGGAVSRPGGFGTITPTLPPSVTPTATATQTATSTSTPQPTSTPGGPWCAHFTFSGGYTPFSQSVAGDNWLLTSQLFSTATSINTITFALSTPVIASLGGPIGVQLQDMTGSTTTVQSFSNSSDTYTFTTAMNNITRFRINLDQRVGTTGTTYSGSLLTMTIYGTGYNPYTAYPCAPSPTSTPGPTSTPTQTPTVGPTSTIAPTSTPRTGFENPGGLEAYSCYVPVYVVQRPAAEFNPELNLVSRECYKVVPYVDVNLGQIGGLQLALKVDDLDLCVTWFTFPEIVLFGDLVLKLDYLLLLPVAWLVRRLLQF